MNPSHRTCPPQHINKTAYAKSVGYTGHRPIIVCDGHVVTHGNRDWYEFLQAVRQGERQRINPSHTLKNLRRLRRATARFINQFCRPNQQPSTNPLNLV